jgi:hypothetical protein
MSADVRPRNDLAWLHVLSGLTCLDGNSLEVVHSDLRAEGGVVSEVAGTPTVTSTSILVWCTACRLDRVEAAKDPCAER